MHAVLITFQSTAELDSLVGPFTDYAHALRAVPGLVTKTWLRDGGTLGGFHLFTTRADADTYLDGSLIAGLTANPAFGEFRLQHYDVLEELSRITGTPQPVVAWRRDRGAVGFIRRSSNDWRSSCAHAGSGPSRSSR